MYLHVLNSRGLLTDAYPSWMDFLVKPSDPLFRFYASIFHQMGAADGRITSDIENAILPRADVRYPSVLYAISNNPQVSGTFVGDGNEIIAYVNDIDFFSLIPSRFAHVESIVLDTEEPEIFAVCYLDSPSGEFYALGHSGIYRYNLSGEVLSRGVYNLDEVSDDLEFVGSRAELSYVPASGTLNLYDRYDLAHAPIDDYILSGTYLYMPYLSGSYVAEYDRLIYNDGVQLGTGIAMWDGYVDGGKIYMGENFGTTSATIPFTLDATPDHVYLVADPRHVRPGRNATVTFSYDVHTIVEWTDSHINIGYVPLSGETFLDESLRVYTTGDNGTRPLYYKDENIYDQELAGSTAIYLEEVETDVSITELRVLSGDYTPGTFYVSYFSRYEVSYLVSGEASYEAASFLQSPNYVDYYEIDDSVLWPKTIFSVTEPLAHIREQMSYAQFDRFGLTYPETYGGICKRHTGSDIWVVSQQLNAYQNRVDGSEFYVSTSPYEIDITYLFADNQVDENWSHCYFLSGMYTVTNPGGLPENKYYRSYPVADLFCDEFQVIGFLGCGKHMLLVLYKDSIIDLLYHDPDAPQRVNNPDVVELAHELTDPKDSFLFNNRLYVLAQNTLEVFQLYFDYRITHGDMWYFRESYGTLEVTP